MWWLSLVVKFLSFCYINGEFVIGYRSANTPDFYENEEGMFSCLFNSSRLTASQFSQITKFGIKLVTKSNASRNIYFCSVERNPSLLIHNNGAPYASSEECSNALSLVNKTDVKDTMYVPWMLNETGTYYCSVWTDEAGVVSQDSSNSILINQLWTPPNDIELFMEPPSPLLAGDLFAIGCRYSPGRPTDGVFISIDGSIERGVFTAELGSSSKNATCFDKLHTNYQNGRGAQHHQVFSIHTFDDSPGGFVNGDPPFYKNDLVLFKCLYNKTVIRSSSSYLLALAVNFNNTEFIFELCSRVSINHSQPTIRRFHLNIKTQQCIEAFNESNPDKFGLLKFWLPLERAGNYSCVTHDRNERRKTILTVDEVRVSPTKNVMSIPFSNHSFFAGDKISAKCEGEGSFPKSQFRYEYCCPLKTLNNSFVAKVEDDGAKISCFDTIHGGSVQRSLRVFPDSVSLRSRHHPDFYAGETSILRCHFHIRPHHADTIQGLGFQETGENLNVHYFAVCEVRNGMRKARGNYGKYLASDDDCDRSIDLLRRGHTARLTIPWRVTQGVTYSCIIDLRNAGYFDQQSLRTKIDRVLVAPTKLTMNVNFQQDIYAGDAVVINCKSEGGTPEPSLKYFVNQKHSKRVFMAIPEHNDKVVGCADLSHRNYHNGSSPLVRQEQKLKVYYVEVTGNFRSRDALKTESVELECLIQMHLPTRANFTYVWKLNGTEIYRNQSSKMAVTYRFEDMARWSCAAECTNQRVKIAEVSFEINWLEPPTTVSISSSLASTTTPSQSISSIASTVAPVNTPYLSSNSNHLQAEKFIVVLAVFSFFS